LQRAEFFSSSGPQKYKTKLKELNLPQYSFKITGDNKSEMIFDPVRKKYVKLTPEEWVRQNFMQYLIQQGKYSPGLMGVEVMFHFNTLKRRTDILIHDRTGAPVMIVECKSPDVAIDDKVLIRLSTIIWNSKCHISLLLTDLYIIFARSITKTRAGNFSMLFRFMRIS
jgi:hypothetical protein